MAFAFAAASCLAAACATGCIVVPVDYYALGARRNISAKTESALPRGTSKVDAILALGEPDFASEDGARLGYGWSKVKALVIVGSYGGGGVYGIQRSYILELSFDHKLRLSNARLIKSWGESVPPISELQTKTIE